MVIGSVTPHSLYNTAYTVTADTPNAELTEKKEKTNNKKDKPHNILTLMMQDINKLVQPFQSEQS